MVDLRKPSMFLIVQSSHLKNSDEQELWTPYIDRRHEMIPMIHVRPFQHDAPLLDCIKKQNLKKYSDRLKRRNYFVMKCIKTNLWYVYHKNMLEEQVYDYMVRTKAFTLIENLYVTKNQQAVQRLLNTMVNDIENLLKSLHDHQLITPFQYHQMNYRPTPIRLDFISFSPSSNKDDMVIFEPTITSILSPLMPICRYLHRLLAPLYYNNIAQHMTITKGSDLIPRLENYEEKGYLQATTHFITIHIQDPYICVSHEHLLKTLKQFLDDYVLEDQAEGINTMTILKLSEFLLTHQYFIFQHSIYRQVTGGGTGLYFNTLLIDIYFFYWQQTILAYQNENEIFVRCFSEIFLTSNETKVKLERIFDKIKEKDSYIQYEIEMKTEHIHFLDAQIHHWNKQTLQTEVYHDWKFEPYIMPTMYDTSSDVPWNLIQTALIRAVLCCSQVEDFQHEQQYIIYSFLFNRFSFTYIRESLEEFFLHFKVADLPLYYDQATYNILRRHVRHYDQENKEKVMKSREEAQKQCIWYIHSSLKGFDLVRANQNPRELLPAYLREDANAQCITIEIIHLPVYPFNTN
ncbi:unnamed protein product [Rotaria sp. Silwood1]|nr:unnamed protein product [Rotaria sp. Silwood1]CAF1612117.1 unnamed protein product [Rotaria sp. Silwood1]CAF3713856.1 unnamed protein product [Rotaria sp. Silwood1]CAF3716731.1 unnamed protein product [Rotaria sp. Silwood1]CAF3730723.1 unnamed protein product [Rotaria sp. Silwood1]